MIDRNFIKNKLSTKLAALSPIVDISTAWPSMTDNIPYGIYISNLYSIDRGINQLAIQPCGSIYNITDEFMILYVSFQDDAHMPIVQQTIANLLSNNLNFDGYHSLIYTHGITYGNRSEKHLYTVNLERIDFNQPILD